MKTILVIPTYNEKENIEKLITKIFALNISDLEILVVDDNSPDGTANIVERLSNKYDIHLLKREGKLGLGSAYIAGFKKALGLGADFIFEMDADFSHDPDDVPRMIEAAQNADLVIGSRKIKGGGVIGWGWTRKFMSNGAMWFSRILLGLKPRDVTAGFRCFRKKVLESIDIEKIKSNGYAFQEELLYKTQKAGFKITEIPVTFVDRQEGKSKLSKKDIIEFFIVMIKLRFTL
ncbi:polyprenol monophosphomannose synthase [Candidatus Parcubacteria bacterium]|jgi:dolichol-phosphate mannosyltransferase|nr:polyprenol monophosphomannose synthase [Candidatus Parcubacteria bacterium]